MNPVTPEERSDSARQSRLFFALGWAVLLSFLAYFVVKNVPHYFVFTAQSYGGYFWPRVSWLFPHVVSGLIAILIGPLQFWSGMRRKYLQAHRIAGRVYVATVLSGSVAALGLAATIDHGSAYSLGLAGLALAWTTTTVMAFVAIRLKNIEQHKQWMIRSYVVTFAFVTFRLLDEALGKRHILSDDERVKLLAWACWAIPLLVAEVVIQTRSMSKARA